MTVQDEDDLIFEDPSDNPDLLAAAQSMMASDEPPTIPTPTDGPVQLPGGYRRLVPGSEPVMVTKAWVRELNGEDEERIAKARLKNDADAFLEAILTSGVERLGDSTPTQDDLRALLIGDRDFLLLEISKATYGDDIEYEDMPCYHCDRPMSFTVHKGEDIPVHRLDNVEDSLFEVRLKNDRVAVVRLPTGEEQVETKNSETDAVANTILIAHCVEEVRGPKGDTRVAGDLDAARRFGLQDRQAIISEMAKRMPGPRYNEVRFVHPDCGNEVRMSVVMADLFRGL